VLSEQTLQDVGLTQPGWPSFPAVPPLARGVVEANAQRQLEGTQGRCDVSHAPEPHRAHRDPLRNPHRLTTRRGSWRVRRVDAMYPTDSRAPQGPP
jgi:hypothetical protein